MLWIPAGMGLIMVGIAWFSTEQVLMWAFAGMSLAALPAILPLRHSRLRNQHSCSVGETLATAA